MQIGTAYLPENTNALTLGGIGTLSLYAVSVLIFLSSTTQNQALWGLLFLTLAPLLPTLLCVMTRKISWKNTKLASLTLCASGFTFVSLSALFYWTAKHSCT